MEAQLFTTRWSDVDANLHIANISYISLMIERRMAFLQAYNIDYAYFKANKIGPVLLKECYTYLKEVMPGEPMYIDFEILGKTADDRFFKLCHHVYNKKGEPCVYAEILLCWMHMETRKIVAPPTELLHAFESLEKSENYQELQKADIQVNVAFKPLILDNL